MILEDGTSFEGELGPGGTCNGKGTLRYDVFQWCITLVLRG